MSLSEARLGARSEHELLTGTTDYSTIKWHTLLLTPRVQHAIVHSIDAAVLIAAAIICLTVQSAVLGQRPITTSQHFVWGTLIVGAAWVFMLWATGSSAVRQLRAGATEYKRVLIASSVTIGSVAIGLYFIDSDYPRSFFLMTYAVGTVGILCARLVRRRIMQACHRRGLLQTPVLVAGAGGHVDAVARVLRRETWLGYKVVGTVTRERAHETGSGLPVLGTLDDVVDVIVSHKVHTVIFAEGSFESSADFRRLAWRLEEHNIQMIVVPTLTDIGSQRLAVRPLAGLSLVDVDRPRAIQAGRWVKRCFDIAVTSALLVVALPVLLLTAIAIKIEDGGPILFRQRRVGLNGVEFDCLKLRSMCVDAEAKLAALEAENQGAGVLFKLRHDPRITRVGRVIRRLSIDELPQLWNTLRGDMSLVGPRPALPREVAQYDTDTTRRLCVRPGLTGLWQVSGRSNLSWEDTVRLDLFYVDNWSMTQDLMILAKTAKAVLGSDGAY